ncbi:MAG: 23S rRNA (pseudouridine(1915)-N(3))-methyltransferase RlmH [Lachnospiraceae bacterium]|nr:23S rRNA (pseudouridine(1915)-N(3))-methyltransferase RlmH [Lachnospiraceae bacterium]MBO7532110.1 23S rRNA (pseudouridine(1915)-N(3))-methyltransferase RlmH [Lachnospiraceae bacterium]MBP5252255.1 23S rRNA (pseudouridine(1915)-N(3))-methyltransferase RlmH [Lachnospiraceae bacterium]MBP5472836.1 23S rRNA (pseudouridine(1915)-N(3))-methyltransferase RlmH [Lachnospiraceae bacterium]MBP5762303.1 23S rRNA (pseudouridine(1915)-N(3))-methyltransferase RlmH [Lachnospiraceae bacterium]
MNITLLCVGRIKESFYRDAVAEYAKRLSAYCTFKVIEVDDEPDTGNSESASARVRDIEGERILKNIDPGMYVITLEIKGKKYDSEKFSGMLSDLFVSGKSDIAFVIGGSLGLSEKVSSRADLKLSFSDMTFPHQLMRVILSEQIYRAFRIMRGEPYHK